MQACACVCACSECAVSRQAVCECGSNEHEAKPASGQVAEDRLARTRALLSSARRTQRADGATGGEECKVSAGRACERVSEDGARGKNTPRLSPRRRYYETLSTVADGRKGSDASDAPYCCWYDRPARKKTSGGVRAPSARRWSWVMKLRPTWYEAFVQPKPSRGMRWKSVPCCARRNVSSRAGGRPSRCRAHLVAVFRIDVGIAGHGIELLRNAPSRLDEADRDPVRGQSGSAGAEKERSKHNGHVQPPVREPLRLVDVAVLRASDPCERRVSTRACEEGEALSRASLLTGHDLAVRGCAGDRKKIERVCVGVCVRLREA